MATKELSQQRKLDYKVVFIEQFAEDVCSYSSQYGNNSSILYTAMNIVGKPSIFPDYGDFPQLFVMRTYGKWWDEAPSAVRPIMPQSRPAVPSKDFVDVTFEEAVFPSQVSVYETFHPGAVVRVWAAHCTGGTHSWHRLYEGPPQPTSHLARIFTPPLRPVSFPTRLLRLEFDHTLFDYYTEIDAVMLSGSRPHPDCEGLGSVTSKIVRQNMHHIPLQVDIRDSFRDFLRGCDGGYNQFLTQIEASLKSPEELPSADSGCRLQDLPSEVLLQILGYLDLRSLCRVCRVSRSLSQLAADPLLYTELSLRDYWWAAPAALAALAHKCSHLRKLDVSWVFQAKVPQLCLLLESVGPQLTHLRLDCSKFVGNKVAYDVGHLCRGLRELSLRGCHNISVFADLASLTCLERLDLYQTQIGLRALVSILAANPGLKHLNVGSCIAIRPLDELLESLSRYNPLLVSLDLWKTVSLTSVGLRFLSSLVHLEELDLGWCLGVNEVADSLQLIAANCPRLCKLFLGACRGLTDRDVQCIAQHCPLLEQVDLVGIRSISSAVCLDLLHGCANLRLLDVSFCDLITDGDVDQMRSLFPSVSIKKSTFVEI